ncbi:MULTISPECIES: pyridoxal phosphate-dependent aminotransferase [unclassified Streptomyces]|uniref:pyridoxal phosphate-dependent aminotransferase n=1 Tax=unclassified Streptomyces TaxID=2593676 RepID=UPI002E3598CA|nr:MULTISPECIES: aminotransferase class I/II-fold pyridoxal phosphate-dependent enzyme [unclassified Streptomyces]WUC64017.1 aminotransferase class I/II-fold pyridoxal phosphate-dependent enzyme [Streptomyces sp. NBC_00539]
MNDMRMSPNLALNQLVAQRRAAGESLVHLGFGESRLPPFPPLMERLAAGATRNAYGPVAGSPEVRAAVAGYFGRRGIPTGPDQIVVAPGSKPLLMAIGLVVPGDVILPRPAWNTYAPQARLAGKHPIAVAIPEECGGVPDPAALRESITAARVLGRDPRILVLTLPDNPTGTLAPPALIRELCAIAEEEGLLIISDEIYRDVVHDPETEFLSPAEVAPGSTVVVTGLSKSLALGGWRIGAARFPRGPWGEWIRSGVVSVASEVWSTLAAPMQSVAEYAFNEPEDIRERLRASARLHGAVAREVHRITVAAGARCRPPTGAFYVYPDFEPVRAELGKYEVTDSPTLARRMLDLGIVVLAGHLLGDEGEALRFKCATSMLYGETVEEQQLALDAPDPLALAHIRSLLERVEDGFMRLVP